MCAARHTKSLQRGPLLARADAIEHFDSRGPRRAASTSGGSLPVVWTTGSALDVWAYFYNRSVAAAERVQDGDYRRYVSRRGPREALL